MGARRPLHSHLFSVFVSWLDESLHCVNRVIGNQAQYLRLLFAVGQTRFRPHYELWHVHRAGVAHSRHHQDTLHAVEESVDCLRLSAKYSLPVVVHNEDRVHRFSILTEVSDVATNWSLYVVLGVIGTLGLLQQGIHIFRLGNWCTKDGNSEGASEERKTRGKEPY